MSTTGKNPAQSYLEMTESMTASKEKGLAPVSYTHLTLPTNSLV